MTPRALAAQRAVRDLSRPGPSSDLPSVQALILFAGVSLACGCLGGWAFQNFARRPSPTGPAPVPMFPDERPDPGAAAVGQLKTQLDRLTDHLERLHFRVNTLAAEVEDRPRPFVGPLRPGAAAPPEPEHVPLAERVGRLEQAVDRLRAQPDGDRHADPAPSR